MNVSFTAGHNKNERMALFCCINIRSWRSDSGHRLKLSVYAVGDVSKGVSAVTADRSELDLVVLSSKLHTTLERSLTLLGLSIGECVRIKEVKTKIFIDGLVSQRIRETGR